jgi:hypothetical protein
VPNKINNRIPKIDGRSPHVSFPPISVLADIASGAGDMTDLAAAGSSNQ